MNTSARMTVDYELMTVATCKDYLQVRLGTDQMSAPKHPPTPGAILYRAEDRQTRVQCRFKDLDPMATIRNFRIVQSKGPTNQEISQSSKIPRGRQGSKGRSRQAVIGGLTQ
jgi:hypothetical protein